jgi:hypothetical protein
MKHSKGLVLHPVGSYKDILCTKDENYNVLEYIVFSHSQEMISFQSLKEAISFVESSK